MDYLSGWCKSKQRLDGCTVIVTGCNTGIGKEAVLDFYKRGGHIIMACRNMDKAKAAKEHIEEQCRGQEGTGTLVVEQLDLCRLESVRAFVRRVSARGRSLRALLCNAGVMMCPLARTEDGFETHIGSNHLAHALLTLLLLPLLIRDPHSRVVFVASCVHAIYKLDLDDLNFEKKPYNAFEAYCRSKSANILFARALADKLKEHNIQNVTTYSLHPGVICTEIGRHFDEGFWYGASWLFQNVLGVFVKSVQCGAQTSIYCTVDESCTDESGLYYSDCAVTRPSKQCQDEYQAAELWDLTIQALKLDLNKFNPFDPNTQID
ncbi:retinol dehydrogenase 11 isoform X3 [Spodoptera frugiperda]|uniref:Retinol dehydrogenase 11 isoform X3 n=1 Tax=Spodoptera frugiperda TaxID=7108 RepID=A0A9R0EF17_SPOFR|nr:retinol dehydrogenase 11 isoform X3 [Spodoptera frugiperda]